MLFPVSFLAGVKKRSTPACHQGCILSFYDMSFTVLGVAMHLNVHKGGLYGKEL